LARHVPPFAVRTPISAPRRFLLALVGVAGIAYGYTEIGKRIDKTYSPTPAEIGRAFVDLKNTTKPVIIDEPDGSTSEGPERSLLLQDVESSLTRIFWGFLFGAIFATVLGAMMSTFADVDAALGFVLTVLASIPGIAFMAYFMVVLGGNLAFQVGIIAYAVALDLTAKVRDSVDLVPKQSVDAIFTLGASRFEAFIHVFRQSMPAIMRAAHTSLSLAWVYLIASESVGAETGLGIRILKVKRYAQIDKMFAVVLVIGALALLFDLVFRYGNLFLFPWDEVNREEIARLKQTRWYRALSRLRSAPAGARP
jgi:ABC-type nitrate/sulfonate/bicarbonate transport system permease component